MAKAQDPIPMPLQDDVREIFGDLFGRGCTVEKTKDRIPFGPDQEEIVLGDFILDDGSVGAVVSADLAMAAYAGAALVMMPVGIAEEALSAGRIDGDMFDCFREVVNVMGRLLNRESTPHLRLRAIYRSGDILPGQTRTMLRQADRRKDFDVAIEEYGTGKLAIMVKGTAA
ncbi:hypothetical protein [Stomatohabitans albus]|uniref:hypothetical protein n=2 Tax=Stomatohabitans albus TaxID=3110766 RepID=UPI00300CC675